MKPLRLMWALPLMAVALLLSACNNDNDETAQKEMPIKETVQPEMPARTIHYLITVNKSDGNDTRATLNESKQYIFEEGDKLYVEGEDLYGVLTLKEGEEGKRMGATFEGDLTWEGSSDAPADELALSAVLVSNSDALHTVTDNKITSTSYLSTAIAPTLNEAVQKYSHFTGSSTYGEHAVIIYQQSCFLNFTVTFEDGTTSGTGIAFNMKNDGTTVRAGSAATTILGEKVVARFVAAFPGGTTTLTNATLALEGHDTYTITTSKALDVNKIYNVNMTAKAGIALSNVTSEHIGMVIAANGRVYNTVKEAANDGTAGRAIIAYVGSEGSADASSTTYRGLAIALKDCNSTYTYCRGYFTNCCPTYTSSYTTAVAFKNGITCTEALISNTTHTHYAIDGLRNYRSSNPAPTAYGTSNWFLPAMGQWNLIVKGFTGWSANLTQSSNSGYKQDSYSSKITAAGGTALSNSTYWSSTQYDAYAWIWGYSANTGSISKVQYTSSCYVRPVIAF